MAENSRIEVNGVLKSWGFITGKGAVNANSGSAIYEPFQLADWRGGSFTAGTMVDNAYKVFPFSQYYVQNIEVPLTLNSGSKEICFMPLFVSYVGIQENVLTFMDSEVNSDANALFIIKNADGARVVKDYLEGTGRTRIATYEGFEISSVEISMKMTGKCT